MKTNKRMFYGTIVTFLLSLILLLQLEIVSVSAQTWDVSARFDTAHCNAFYPFSSTPGEIGKTYYAKLNGSSDNLYTEYHGRECCSSEVGGCGAYGYWGDLYEKDGAIRKGPWVVERKYVDDSTYRILIRGASKADCSCGGNGYVKGEVVVNPDSGWKITSIVKNSVNNDTRGRDVYCDIDKDTGVIKFAGGSTCNGCCCCIDSGEIDIEVIVKRVGGQPVPEFGSLTALIAILLIAPGIACFVARSFHRD
ncbi:MAG: hypothetical protein DRO89_01435 [Candidatus Altiarchaeales archaeon]|nr:MAG: hypothetical protein DRO89_01435 [Candidatus Altiarchaeales archaeon]